MEGKGITAKVCRGLGLLAALTLVFSLCLAPSARAEGLFFLTINTAGQSYTKQFVTVQDLVNNFNENEIKANLTNYVPGSSQVTASLNYRGLPIVVTVAANSPNIVLDIPALGILNKVFTGSNRDQAMDSFENWVKTNQDNILARMNQYLAANEPTDPVAGNPGSQMGTMEGSDYNTGFTEQVTQVETPAAPTAPAVPGEIINANLIALSASFGGIQMGEFEGSFYKLPLSYTWRSNRDKRFKVKVSMPMGLLITEGAQTYNVGLGVAVAVPLNKWWVLTPALNYAIVGSYDLGAGAQMYSASLTSAISFKLGKTTVNIGNMVGYYSTMRLEYEGYSYDPKIRNTLVKNGLMFSIPLKNTLVMELFATDTRYFGSELYIDQYNEVGFALGLSKTKSKDWKGKVRNTVSSFKVGGSYIFGRDYSSWELNFGYTF